MHGACIIIVVMCVVVSVILRLAVSVEHQLVTDRQTDRQTDRHRAIASTMLAQCHAGRNDVFMCVMFVFVIRISWSGTCCFSQWHTIRVRRYQKKHSPAHTHLVNVLPLSPFSICNGPGILFIQLTCLTVLLDNLFLGPLWSSPWS